MSERMVEALYARIRAGVFVPGEGFPYADFAAGVPQSKLAQQREAYRAEARRLEKVEFKAEALVAVGLDGHPKADKAFEMAYERGHSAGLHEVLIELLDLSELLA